MNEQPTSLRLDPAPQADTRWRSPGYQVVETSLEVTMYVSATR